MHYLPCALESLLTSTFAEGCLNSPEFTAVPCSASQSPTASVMDRALTKDWPWISSSQLLQKSNTTLEAWEHYYTQKNSLTSFGLNNINLSLTFLTMFDHDLYDAPNTDFQGVKTINTTCKICEDLHQQESIWLAYICTKHYAIRFVNLKAGKDTSFWEQTM